MYRLMMFLLGLASTALAHEPLNLNELIDEFGWDFEAQKIQTETIGDGLYVLYGVGE